MTKIKSLLYIVLPVIVLAIISASLIFVGVSKSTPNSTNAATTKITFNPNGSTLYIALGGGTSSSAGMTNIQAGGSSTFTATLIVGNGYYFQIILKSGCYFKSFTTPMGEIAVNVGTDILYGDLTANFSSAEIYTNNYYTVSASSNNTSLGTVSGGGNISYGSSTTLTATPKSGAKFSYWLDNNGNKKTTASITVSANDSILYSGASSSWTAYFETVAVTYTYNLYSCYYTIKTPLTYIGTTGGTVGFSSSCGNSSVSTSTTATALWCYASRASGYELKGWYTSRPGNILTDTITAVSTSYSYYNSSGYTNLYALFGPAKYSLNINLNGGTYGYYSGGTYQIDTQQASSTYDLTDWVTYIERTGYTFSGFTLSGGGSLSGNTYTYGYSDGTLTAQWTIKTGTLKINPNSGTYSGSTSTTTKTGNYNTTFTLSTPTRSGYVFAGWTLSGVGSLSGSVYTFGDGTGTVTASWTQTTFNISKSTTYCSISGPSTWYGTTTSAVFTITPYTGYAISTMYENASTSYSLNISQSSVLSKSGFSYKSSRDTSTGVVTLTITNVTRAIKITATATKTLNITNSKSSNISSINSYRASTSDSTATLSATYSSGTMPEITFNSGEPVKLVTASGKGKVDSLTFSYTFANNVLSLRLSNITSGSIPTIVFNTDTASTVYSVTSNKNALYEVTNEYLFNGKLLLTICLGDGYELLGINIGGEDFYFGTICKYLTPVANTHSIYIDNNKTTNTLCITIDINQPLKTSTSTTYATLSLILA